jgi:hypothetical protein
VLQFIFMTDTSQNSHKEKADDQAKAKAKEQADQKAGSRKGITLSNFLVFAFGSVGLALVGLAINYHTKGGYHSVKLALLWGIIGYALFGVGLYFAYFEYVIKPTRAAERARQKAEAERALPSERPELFVEHTTPDPIAAGKNITIRMIVRNRGRLTAHKIRIAAMHSLFKSSFTGPLRYYQPNPPDISPSLGVGASYEYISVSPWTVKKAHLADLKSGNIRLFHYGKGTYEDDRGNEFVFQFCATFEPSVRTMVMCPDKYVPVSLSEEPKRPYLVVESAAVNLIAGEQVDVYVVLGNRGEEAATSLWLEGVTTVKRKPFDGPLDRKGMTRSEVPINLAPDMRMTTTLREPQRWTAQGVADIKSEKYLLFHYGRGEYGDASGNVYPIEYCLRYERIPAKTVQGFPYLGFCESKFWPKDEEEDAPEQQADLGWADYREDYFFGAIWRWKYRPEMGDREPRNIFGYCADCERLLTYVREFAKKRRADGFYATWFNCQNRTHKSRCVRSASSDPIEGIRDLIRKRLESGEWEAVVRRQKAVRNGHVPSHVSKKQTEDSEAES